MKKFMPIGTTSIEASPVSENCLSRHRIAHDESSSVVVTYAGYDAEQQWMRDRPFVQNRGLICLV